MGAGVPINQPLGSYWHLLGGAGTHGPRSKAYRFLELDVSRALLDGRQVMKFRGDLVEKKKSRGGLLVVGQMELWGPYKWPYK